MNSSKNDLVSIILVNWNGKKWLKKCLDSLVSQTYKNLEIILIDNASTDDSIKLVKEYFPEVKIILNKKNLGFPKANNIGVLKSKGKYLLLINNDTWVKNDFIEKLYEFYKKNEFAVISPIEKDYAGKKINLVNPTIDPTGSPAFFILQEKKNKLFFTSVCYFCQKKDYLETLGFDENYFVYYEDVDWFWRMSLLGIKYGYASDVYIHHAGAGATGKGINYNMFLYRNQNALQTILKNYSLLTLIFVLPLYFLQNLFEITFFLALLKPKISYSYFQGWFFNIQNFKKILKKRKWIQKKRKIGDLEILRKMYLGPAKLRMLLNYK